MDPKFSRSYPRVLTGVQWAAVLALLERAVAEARFDDEAACMVEEMLPDLRRDVGVYRDLEPVGCGLDHPDLAFLRVND